jgi:two-component system chemotaxis sensor kinase CheA
MDVVRKAVEALRGRTEITSQRGAGSTFTLRLPLTMAIIDGMITKVGTIDYVFPTLSLERTFRPSPEQIVTYHGHAEALHDRDRILPIVRLGRVHGVAGAVEQLCDGLLVIAGDNQKQAAFLVDELVGQQ